ncbi:MAG: DNA-directed RNA polymerase [Candidatus Poseidoniia archaeon]|jgi:DNA-directed RNA polymerase subunit E'|nr:DNA-directed RNA polymerase [Candidatus Poseidoniia archaeon]MDP6659155.1 DNA-directed RNA polymerase [Candidatus Poseidoniia archaeon]MDP6846978.1 DNA-directed RNA polymerase [Candidatus Poseidoniia archaeon]MDP7007788.1 DNA-directed RNA polymerase [Candidatus Poseidoniia archaeon]|tara:strand:+ start:5127 stop:5687 length:561 start_codon:yes stop_codon:yes gene_type:complete
MYYTHTREDMVRIPPDRLGENIEKVTMELARQAFEGRMGPDQKLVVLITSLKLNGDSRVVHGDGAVYQPVRIQMLLFDIRIQEVIEGLIDQVTEYGAFVRFGPLDGLLHVSQIQDDHINVDVGGQRLVGKETKRELRVEDRVRSRIVTISLNEVSPRESKIGLTMRQPGLGKLEWIAEDHVKAEAA